MLACVRDGASARALAWQLLPSASGSAWSALDPAPASLTAAVAGGPLEHGAASASLGAQTSVRTAGAPSWAAAAAAASAAGGGTGAQVALGCLQPVLSAL